MPVISSFPRHVLCANVEAEAQPGRAAPGLRASKTYTQSCNMSHCAAQPPGTRLGLTVVMVSRQSVAGMCTGPCSCRPSQQLFWQLRSLGLDATLSLHYPKWPPWIPLLHCCYYLFIDGGLSLWMGTYLDVPDSRSGAPLRTY